MRLRRRLLSPRRGGCISVCIVERRPIRVFADSDTGVWSKGGSSRDEVERVVPQRQLAPHAAQHFFALLLLARQVLLVRAVTLISLVLGVVRVVCRLLASRRLLDVQLVHAH